MIQEDYVSFEVAKLLKEKGFNEYCLKNYWSSDKELHDWKWELSYKRNSDENCNTKDCAAPTLQMAMKWLREKGWHITIDCIDVTETGLVFTIKIVNMKSFFEYRIDYDNMYEKAVEAALKYVLENLI